MDLETTAITDEIARLNAVRSYGVLDSPPNAVFEMLARHICAFSGMPIGIVTVLDAERLFFLAAHGHPPVREMPRNAGFLEVAAAEPGGILVVEDTTADPRFAANPAVTGMPFIRFYAGVPLYTTEGYLLGSVAACDHRPNKLSAGQEEALRQAAVCATTMLETCRSVYALQDTQRRLSAAYADLDRFASVIAHDLKSPLNGIMQLTGILKKMLPAEAVDEDTTEVMDMIGQSAQRASTMVAAVLQYSRDSRSLHEETTDVAFDDLLDNTMSMLPRTGQAVLQRRAAVPVLRTNRTAVQQVLLNLISNAMRYADKPDGRVLVELGEVGGAYRLSVQDNGPGISKADAERIFEPFFTTGTKGNDAAQHGIGLATVKRLVTAMGGSIEVQPAQGGGTRFDVELPRAS